jgi:hypothetical protein
VPETLDTLAATIRALATSIDKRFAKVDQQFAETKAQLGVKIEAVDDNVVKVYDAVIALQAHAQMNTNAHQRFTERPADHDVRILALEHQEPPRP